MHAVTSTAPFEALRLCALLLVLSGCGGQARVDQGATGAPGAGGSGGEGSGGGGSGDDSACAGPERWEPIEEPGWTPVYHVESASVWTGSQWLLWGGRVDGEAVNAGVGCDTKNETWFAFQGANPPPAPHWKPAAAWAASRLIVWGGNELGQGGIYHPETDAWTPTAAVSAPPASTFGGTVASTGSQMILWGGYGWPEEEPAAVRGAMLDPLANTWTAIPAPDFPVPYLPVDGLGVGLVWTGSRMVVWGGKFDDSPLYYDAGGVYDPSTATWSTISAADAPQGRYEHCAVWTGSGMFVWGGRCYRSRQSAGFRWKARGGAVAGCRRANGADRAFRVA